MRRSLLVARSADLGDDGDRLRRVGAAKERRHVPPRHGRRDRLPQPVRRVQPGRLQRVRVHLSRPRPVRQQAPLRPVLRDVVARLERRQDVDVQDAAERQVERRQAAHRGRRRLDDQHRHQVQGRRRRELRGPRQPHHERDRAEPDDARRQLRRGAGPTWVLGQFQQFFILPKHIWAQHTRPQGRRPEDVPEQRAGRRLRPVQPRQVPEEQHRDLPAQRLLLGHEAEDRGVRAAAVLERRRDGHRPEGARPRLDRGRARRPR